MSGKNQHIVPQFLQKGFANNEQVYTYNKNKVYLNNIKNNLAERYFYSSKNNTYVDDYVTNKEQIYSKLLYQLKNDFSNQTYFVRNNPLLSEFILHLFLRTKDIQKFLLENYFEQWLSVLEKITSEEVYLELKKRQKNLSNKKHILLLAKIQKTIIPTSIELIKAYLINEHQNNCRNILTHSIDTNFLYEYQYTILNLSNEIILSDNIILSITNNGKWSSSIDFDSNHIFLPISSHQICVLSKNNLNINYIKNINEEISKTSSEKFIAQTNKFSHLQKLIGTNNFSKDFITQFPIKKEQQINKLIQQIKNIFQEKMPQDYSLIFK